MEPPDKLQIGPPWLSEAFNRLREFAISLRPLPSATCEVHESPSGTQILPISSSPTSAPTSASHAFRVVDASSDEGAHVRVYSGVVNGMDPEDDGPFSVADAPPLLVAVANNWRVYVELTVAYDAPTAVWSITSYNVLAASALPAASATKAYYPLATVAVTSAVVTGLSETIGGNIGWRRCGDSTTYNDEWWAAP